MPDAKKFVLLIVVLILLIIFKIYAPDANNVNDEEYNNIII